jgi:glutathione S-transferase
MKAKLYWLTLSHPSRAVRSMLELKGVDHEAVELLPGTHPVRLRATGFPAGTVPALTVDGERVQGSVRISRFLEHRVP